MPESKKLSELIDEFIDEKRKLNNTSKLYTQELKSCVENLIDLRCQIDQKFEELRCECKKKEEKMENDVYNLSCDILGIKNEDKILIKLGNHLTGYTSTKTPFYRIPLSSCCYLQFILVNNEKDLRYEYDGLKHYESHSEEN